MKVILDRYKIPYWNPTKVIPISKMKPFVMNSRAVLIHRPRKAAIHKLKDFVSHVSIEYWCGATASGGNKFTLLSSPPEDMILCARCEENAVMAGHKPSSEIAGRHVCTGGVKAVKRCCKT